MKILFICIGELNIRNWSGTTYNIYERLKAKEDIKLEVLELTYKNQFKKFLFKIYNFIMKLLGKKIVEYNRSKSLLKKYSKLIQLEIEKSKEDFDAIFSIGSLPVTFLQTNIPIYIYTDGTVKLMQNYYEDFSNFSERTLEKLNNYEKTALSKSKIIFVASNWVKKSIEDDYNINKEKIKEVKIGANFESKLSDKEIISIVEERAKQNKINILFVGVNWDRKGGNKLVEIANMLNSKKKVKVNFVGIKARELKKAKFEYEFLGFLNKNDKEDREKLYKLYKEATFFVLPTKAECVGSVFCEAASFGLPVITTNTGGIPSLVENNVTGKLFEVYEDSNKIADYIIEVFNNKEMYKDISKNALERYNKALNWESIVNSIYKEINEGERDKNGTKQKN